MADASFAASALLEALGEGEPSVTGTEARVVQVKAAAHEQLTESEKQHAIVLASLRRALPADGLVATDMTQLAYSGSAMFPVEAPRLWNYPAGYCTLGSALPDAIGASLAVPGRPVVAIVGDGGFMFTPQELVTASELGLPIPIILWNNNGLKQIRDDMKALDIDPLGTDGLNPDFMLLAESMHARGVRPSSAEQFEQSVVEALAADRPTVIEVVEGSDWLTQAQRGAPQPGA